MQNDRSPSSFNLNFLLFVLMHLGCLLVFVPAIWNATTIGTVVLAATTLLVRKFGITAGFHRYFSHRTFKTGRAFQFILAWIGGSAAQKGALWWASQHRHHHAHSDQPADVHSPARDGLWWAHVGWVLSSRYEATRDDLIKDLVRFPELRWLNRWHLVPPITLAAACLAIDGLPGLVWGFVLSTVVLYHTTFSINSLCHVIGRRRFDTTDDSRNSLLLALITLGEGWHNNHHYFQGSVNQGFYWWEIDITYYVLTALSWFGVVRDLKRPPRRVLELGRRRTAQPDVATVAA